MDHKDHQLYEPQENCKYEIIDLQQIDRVIINHQLQVSQEKIIGLQQIDR